MANPEERSPVVGTIDIDGFDANELCQILRANGVLDTDSYRKLGATRSASACSPPSSPTTSPRLCATIDYIAERLLHS